MKRLVCDSHHVWEVSPAPSDDESHILTEQTPYEPEEAEASGFDLFSVNRYWNRRHEFWPNFSDGICTDTEGLFSVTPWDAACQIAAALDEFFPGEGSPLVVDACCGVGGNTIAFAKCLRKTRAIGVDISATRLVCAKRNAEVFGVSGNTDFVRSDAIAFLREMAGTVRFVFSSPPWGGPGYSVKTLEDLPFDVFALADACCDACEGGRGKLALYLPRKFPIKEAKRLATKGGRLARFDVTTGPNNRLIASCFLYEFKR